MKKLLILFTLAALAACTPQSADKAPEQAWAFRSVLDEQARMLSTALKDSIWVAYDTQEGLLYKGWKGFVAMDGAVYTTQHGPQPTSEGKPYFQRAEDAWFLKRGEETRKAKVQHKGHTVQNGVFTIKYDLITPEGQKISISESPKYVQKGQQDGLERVFVTENASDYQVVLQTNMGFLASAEDYSTDGEFVVAQSGTQAMGGVEIAVVQGSLILNNGTTSLTTMYHPDYEQIEIKEEGEEDSEETPKGLSLINQSDCRACHNETLKTVGPSYTSIARKYVEDEETVEKLVGKILQGGAGVWGEAMMTAHPGLEEADAKEMVQYILQLDDEDNPFLKYALGKESVPLKLGDKYDGAAGSGFLANLYDNREGKETLEVPQSMSPVKQGVTEQIHAFENTHFAGFGENFVIEFNGILNIEKDGSYDFRLISDDGSFLFINDQLIIDNGGLHGPQIRDGEMYLKAGSHEIRTVFAQAGGGALISLQWFDKKAESFVLLGGENISFSTEGLPETQEYVPEEEGGGGKSGDGYAVAGVHPAFDLFQARPDDFQPRVGGIDFLEDERMVVCTWDSMGAVYVVDNWQSGKPANMTAKRIAFGLAEPLGLTVVDNEIYILQKQELTKLVDLDGDEYIDEYQTVSNQWKVSANFHEFAFGLVYQDGYFYGALATAILPGGASADPQIPDRGKVVKINKETGEAEFIAYGLRTPNGIGVGVDNELFIADNQGDWLPSSKIVHVKQDAFYGSRSVDFEGTEGVEEMLPVVWLPQDEIGNSPSTPIELKVGPYRGQMIHGEVTNGGIKRVFVEQVGGEYQGALFRFSQGFEAGVNRILWAPDGSLMVGGVGSSGNWSHAGKVWYGLQRMVYNGKTAFEMLAVRAQNDGFEIEFTEPLKEGIVLAAKDLMVQQWWYKPTQEYGGPKLDQEDLPIQEMQLSEDRTKLLVQLGGMKENHVVYFRLGEAFQSASGNPLWSTECWYTLNRIPEAGIASK